MLDRADILRILAGYGFGGKEYWVMTGASLVLYGVREQTRDIDLGVTQELFDRLIAEGREAIIDKDGDKKLLLDEYTEVFPEWRPMETELVCGVPCATLESTVVIKQGLGREKDKLDIERIRAWQENRKA